MRAIVGIISATLLLMGCSYQAWHAGFVEGQRYQCNKLSGTDRQHCLEAIRSDFENYTRERQETLQRSD